MFRRRRTHDTHHTTTAGHERGLGLAKVPALAIGSVLVAFGLSGLLTNSAFPDAGTAFPDGTATGESWLGLEVNGWTNWFVIAAGALLLFGAARHALAKTMSVIVGLAMAAAAVIALVDGDDVLGLAATNGWTILGFAVTAVLLLMNVLTPRPGRRDHHHEADVDTSTRRHADERHATTPGVIPTAHDGRTDPDRTRVAGDEGPATAGRFTRDPVADEDPRLARHEGPVDLPDRR